MDSNNMTGETGQQNPPSVFGYDPYPPLVGLNWNQTNPFANSPNSTFNMCAPDQVPFSNVPTNYVSVDQSLQRNQMTLPSTSTCVPPAIHPFGVPGVPQPSYSFGTARPMPEVMQFPFLNMNAMAAPGEFRCKRKTDSPPLQPAKQHITEEKMAEHLSKLHISSETPAVSETETSKIRRLYMCEEMRKLQSESIIPKSLLDKIQRPCTALVLWKPPASRLISQPPRNEEVDENDNNNTDISSESNMVDMASVVSNMEMDNC